MYTLRWYNTVSSLLKERIMRHEEFLEKLAYMAGEVLQRHHTWKGVPFTLKGDQTLITEVDVMISELMGEMTARHYPEATFISEELDFPERKQDGIAVIGDPLDGTKNFAEGGREATVAIAVHDERKNKLLASVIYAPLLYNPAMYLATKGHGATLNGKRIRVASATGVGRVAVATAGSPTERFDATLVIAELVRRGWIVVDVKSISHAFALLAAGFLNGVLFPWGKLHDVAPGDLLIQEAGGFLSDLNGNKLDYGGSEVFGCVAANSEENHCELLRVAKKYRR